MGAKERRDRERSNVRRQILDAVRQIAVKEGWASVTIRRVAEEIDYTSPIIYQHFANKEAMLAEVRREGFVELLAAIDLAIEPFARPEERVLAMTHAQVEFAFEAPELYQVMFNFGGVACDSPTATPEAQLLAEQVHTAVGACVHPNARWATDVPGAARALVGATHGLIALHLEQMFDGGVERATALAGAVARTLLESWTTDVDQRGAGSPPATARPEDVRSSGSGGGHGGR